MKSPRSTFISTKITNPVETVSFETPREQPRELAVTTPPAGDMTGDIDSSDLRIASLAVKHAIDTRFEEARPGDLILYCGSDLIAVFPPPITLIPIHLKKGYLQKGAEAGEIPQRFWSKEAMEEAGGCLDAKQVDMLLCAPFADITVLIAGLEDNPGVILFDILGKKYSPAIFTAKNSAFAAVAKAMITQVGLQKLQGDQNARLLDYPWELGVRKQASTYGTFLVPTVKRGNAHSPEMVAALLTVSENL